MNMSYEISRLKSTPRGLPDRAITIDHRIPEVLRWPRGDNERVSTHYILLHSVLQLSPTLAHRRLSGVDRTPPVLECADADDVAPDELASIPSHSPK